jgi:hypothetical protein
MKNEIFDPETAYISEHNLKCPIPLFTVVHTASTAQLRHCRLLPVFI